MGKFGMVLVAALALVTGPARADDDDDLRAELQGFEEVPVTSTTGSGRLIAEINKNETEIKWTLSYRDLEGAVTQAHIHFGQPDVNGGISVWFCSNPPIVPPPGTQPCPPPPAKISGTFTASSVAGPTAQGIAPTELAELIRAIRAGVTYANVHSTKFPGGEIRGAVRDEEHGDHHGKH
jgi:CHRD domain-containing protein